MSAPFRDGVACAGNWTVEHLLLVTHFPSESRLARITDEQRSFGGCAYNVIRNLHDLDPDLFLYAIGVIGEDQDGHDILDDLHSRDVDTFQLIAQTGVPTARAMVMIEAGSGRRASFYHAGGNAVLAPAHFDFSHCLAAWLHLGSLLLLDLLDAADSEFGTAAARVLHLAKAAGLTTSIDLISDEQADYTAAVGPALPYVDFLIANEFEARHCSKSTLPDGARISRENLVPSAEKLLAGGVRQAVVIHFPEGAVAVTKSGAPVFVPSLQLPSGYIRNHCGAGDAFSAAFIYATRHGWPLEKRLQLGHCAAAQNLAHVSSSGGLLPGEKNLELLAKFAIRNAT